MKTRHLVDPELLPILDMLPFSEISAANLAAARAGVAQMQQAYINSENSPVTVEQQFTDARPGAPAVRVLVYRPVEPAGLLPAIFHIHGGGYVLGMPEISASANHELAVALGCVIVSVDYRLAPETTHPGPVEDCYTALEWLYDHADALNVDQARIAISGQSAGGGLAAALALMVRDRGKIRPVLQHLIFPMLDDRTGVSAEANSYTGEFVWTPASNRFGWSALLGTSPGQASIPLYAAAARAEDLRGLPPAFIAVGTLDLFLDEDVEYALRLTRAGVPVELHVYPGAFHGYQLAAGARVTIAAERDSQEALRRALYG